MQVEDESEMSELEYIVKNEPPDESEYNLDNDSNFASEFVSCNTINADIATFLDVKIENESSDEVLYDSEHEQMHLSENNIPLPFNCKICNRGFQTYRNLKLHSNALHAKKTEDPLSTCTICHKKFETRRLTHHFKKHKKPVKAFQCPYCICSYLTENLLNAHIGSHLGFDCKKCKLSFEDKKDLTNHYKTHLEDLYACNICDASFSTTSELTTHVRFHKKKRKVVENVSESSTE